MPFNTSISGINAASTLLNVTANNIANAETSGFKGSRPEFADFYANSRITGSQRNAGLGTQLTRISQNFNQGTLETTQNPTDLAIDGEGFFVVQDPNGNLLYTRAGAFNLDREGYIVNAQGQNLQAFAPVDDSGQFDTSQLIDLQITTEDIEPRATQEAAFGLNLAADARRPDARRFNPDDPSSYNYSTSVVVYDTQGIAHNAQVYFEKTGRNRWQTHVYVDGNRTGRPTALRFDRNGNIRQGGLGGMGQAQDGSEQGQAGAGPQINVNYRPRAGLGNIGERVTQGAGRQSFTLDLSGVTQYDSNYGVNYVSQDGYTSGVYQGIEVDDQGIVYAVYSNGERMPAGQVALANFINPQGLSPTGDTAWAQSSASGEPVYGQPGTGRLGQVRAYSLEASNIDLAYELTRLIIAQRDYSANTQALSTENNNIQTLLNIR